MKINDTGPVRRFLICSIISDFLVPNIVHVSFSGTKNLNSFVNKPRYDNGKGNGGSFMGVGLFDLIFDRSCPICKIHVHLICMNLKIVCMILNIGKGSGGRFMAIGSNLIWCSVEAVRSVKNSCTSYLYKS